MDKELAASIGTAARAARSALKLTQEDAAERIGVSAEFYARIERGNALPSVPTLARLCTALGVDADVLIGRVDTDGSQLSQSSSPPGVPAPPPDAPELRRLAKRLRDASPGTLRLITLLVKVMEEE